MHLCWERLADPVARVSTTLIQEAKAAGLGVILWHEEREHMLKQIRRLSEIYGVCTNVPDRVRRILALSSGPPPLASGGQTT